ncbi:hypothetical protein SPYJRS4_0946 [Streptococcus pyogenes JRS4]|nr:Hypothetical protein M6_Spy0901 [Streptococcus pyogenes MGAS10394]BAR44446.1 hypothetical protein SPYJRS4_0946 [Streptococcus pyogenes JRS4]
MATINRDSLVSDRFPNYSSHLEKGISLLTLSLL